MALRRNILIFHLGALGDFVLTWPLALALGRLYPQSRLFYVTHASKGKLAERVLRVESADVEGGWHSLFDQPAALAPPAAKLLAGAHTVVSFLADDQARWSHNVREIAPEATLASLSAAPPDSFDGHVTEWIAQQLEIHPVMHEALRQMLRSVAGRGVLTALPTPPAAPTVVIHPGAGSPQKCYPAEHYLSLAKSLAASGRRVRVLLGEVELERWGKSACEQFADAAEVRRPRTYLELLDELLAASAFVGNDSGPGHLAGMIGLPTLCLFGPASRPSRWRPLGPRVRVIETADLATLAPRQVYDAIQEAIEGDRA